jgi:PTH1 family peptidyl-tRNA hydrolase
MGLFGRGAKGTPFDWLVIGLGNPGKQYARSRHNVGEEVVRLLAERHSATFKAGKHNAEVAEARFGDQRVVLAFPLTYMNESGRAASSLVRYAKVESPEQIVIVHDELDLPPGEVKLKAGGGLAGHNGLRSVTQHLSTQDYLRVRIGVGKPPSKEHGAGHVLNRVPPAERQLLDVAVVEAADAVEAIVARGIDAAMRELHGR